MLPLHQSPETTAPYDTLERGMRGLRTTIVALAVLAFVPSAQAVASNASATRAYLKADYSILHTTVSGWPRVEANFKKLDAKFEAECPKVGAGSPQNEEAQKFSLEVAGALWATGYDTNAAAVQAFAAKVSRLTWSNRSVTRAAHKLAKGLKEMTALGVPPLCADVRAWAANGFGAAPADVTAFSEHAEAIEVEQIPHRLLAPYLSGADRALAATDERLNKRFEELEFVRGQDQWNKLLEVLSLNQ